MNVNEQKLNIAKKWLSSILGTKSEIHNSTLERICTVMLTNKDLEDFSKLISDVYHTGYQKAMDDNKAQLEKLGYSVEIKS